MPKRLRHDGQAARKQRPGVTLGAGYAWQTHGAFSLLRQVTKGDLDGRTGPAQAIKAVCLQLAADLGVPWATLPIQQRLLSEQVALKAVILSMMSGYALRQDSMLDAAGHLKAPLSGHYLAWSNSLRLDLQVLGIDRKQKQVLDLAGYVAARYGNAKGGTQMPPSSQETQPGRAGGPGDGPARASEAK